MDPKRCKLENHEVKYVKKTCCSTSINLVEIQEELLMEVLIRLPVKEVFRVKQVCKRWLSVISNPSFTRMYILRASVLLHLQTWALIYSPRPLYIYGNGYSNSRKYELLLEDVYSRDFKCPSFYAAPFPCKEDDDYMLAGVSNGLLLYVPRYQLRGDNYVYFICNPITKQRVSLPPYACRSRVKWGFVTHVQNGGVNLSSYRVVCLRHPVRHRALRFEVFVSETSEWKRFDVRTEQEFLGTTCLSATALNGILHWVTRQHGIMAYDPYQKPDSLRIIPLPRDADPRCNNTGNIFTPSFCGAHQGHLRYFQVSDIGKHPHGFSGFSVWILNDYSTGDWCLQHRINCADIIYDEVLIGKGHCSFLKPIYFHPFDSEIVYLVSADNETLISYNIKTRKLERSLIHKYRRRYAWWITTFSFVIPPWPLYIY